MKRVFFLFTVLFLTAAMAKAQFDIKDLKANSKTFIFNDGKHTVNNYIYNQLETKTSCCGNDAIFVEVVFDKNGKVTNVKAMTGKNECYKKSIVDIIKQISWDATGVSNSKTVYFEVKPTIPCSGAPGENVYKPVTAN